MFITKMKKKSHLKQIKKLKGSQNIIITTGGTGGHIVPAMKIASDLIKKGRSVFFITDKRFSSYESLFSNQSFFSSPNFKIYKTPITGFSGIKSPFTFVKNCLVSLFITISVFMKAKPKIVIGFGSYVSFFPLLIATLTFRNIILHEQNVVLGKVNKLFSWPAKNILLSFPDVSYFSEKEYNRIKEKLIFSGLPTFLPDRGGRKESIQKVIYDVSTKEQIVIAITGGGQGATFFSKNIPPAIISLATHYPEKQFMVYHQVKKGEIEDVLKTYASANLQNLTLDIKPFFDNMPKILAKADFAIIRGGAASIVETSISKVFPIIIPMPRSADNHQVKNANVLSRNNAAVMLPEKDYTPHKLYLIISKALKEGLFYFPIINTASELFKGNTSQIFASVILYEDLKHLKL